MLCKSVSQRTVLACMFYILGSRLTTNQWRLRRFGKVVSGQDVVSAIEQVGNESGKTRVPVIIADSGQLR
jgi:cyclophilin family peptidyl-prolyl cis-trans isomerase